ncbi:hypothetical protein [Nostoc sp. 'Peltigera membranacea cyanobiont' N6]|uniref:hypothetical protein n=1 Tax=Nostoc sp. 'Peltigera membranacea cyanobiont' N6 TaxID=1261031 RepID=UPI000D0C5403|nr:hypothetical protein [Nostoc sp. 'Peltigera membranacea cyanobiont' N6]AVH68168.1 hypothetical protein NPM_10083 [Nostoc sp. 'Peltigera membranacea cyanobiont' N6]
MTDNKQVVSQLTQQRPRRVLVVAPSELTIHHRHRQTFQVLPTLSNYIFKVIAKLSIVSAMLFGISALGYWGLEIVEANTIPTIEDRYDWQTQKHICFGWMLFTFSSFLGSASFGDEFTL